MEEEQMKPPKRGPIYWIDGFLNKFIPNFNLRAILYFSVLFAVVMFIQIWRFSEPSPSPKPTTPQTTETVIADEAYWDSTTYTDRIKNQTVESFTNELARWLSDQDQEFTKRKFEDVLYINAGLAADDLMQVVPESFNEIENIGHARYRYAKENGFLSEQPTLVSLGTIVCNVGEKTEQVTGIKLYDFRYASMPNLAAFLKTKPDWKMRIGDRILDVSDPRMEDKELLRTRTSETQPTGLFSFLVFHDPTTNRITLADKAILDMNGVDAALTLSRIDQHWDKEPKLYFASGYEGCKQIHASPQIPYGHTD